MTAIAGLILVLLFVFGGFALSGGNLFLIFAPWHEFLIIAGAALGGLIVKTSPRTLKLIVKQITNTFKGQLPNKQLYIETLTVFQVLSKIARREGLIVLEKHINDIENSAAFSKSPMILNRPDLLNFIVDNLKLILLGITPEELEYIIDTDIETAHEEHSAPQHILANTADALPGLGIVAAVLGIIKTMASISEGPEVVGEKVAGALVGTFLGVLLSYGFVGPLATNIEMANIEEQRVLQVLKQGLLNLARGANPRIGADYSRHAIYTEQRPTSEELEVIFKE
jgi:chemotaxis protein MotA